MRTEKLEAVNVTSINDFLDDKLRWCFKWGENRVRRRTPKVLDSGKKLHEAFERHFKEPEWEVDEGLRQLLPPPGTILDPEDQKVDDALRGLLEPLALWKDQPAIDQTLEAEEPFTA